MLFTLWLTLTFIFLISTFILVALSSAFRRLHKQDALTELKTLKKLFLYGDFHRYFFQKNEYEGLFFSIIFTQHVSRLCYAICFILTLSNTNLWQSAISFNENYYSEWSWVVLITIAFIIVTWKSVV